MRGAESDELKTALSDAKRHAFVLFFVRAHEEDRESRNLNFPKLAKK